MVIDTFSQQAGDYQRIAQAIHYLTPLKKGVPKQNIRST